MARRFAQIEGEEVRWIFEAEEPPEFAPYIKIVEITDRPDVQERWTFKDSQFAPPPEHSSAGTPGAPMPPAQPAMRLITPYMLTPTFALPEHQHEQPHLGVVIAGRVRVTIGGVAQDLDAPAAIDLPAHVPHKAEALTPLAVFLSIFTERPPETGGRS